MLAHSLDAVRNVLKNKFPSVTRIYVNKVPDKFVRPSFFIMLASRSEEDLNKKIYTMRATWQIVYFAPEGKSSNADAFNQYSVSDSLHAAFKESPALIGPDGTVFNVTDVSGGPRDNEVYMTISLEAQNVRTETISPLMGDVKLN